MKTYFKDIFREFKNSISKVLSIMTMIALACLVISGLGHTGQSMRDSLNYKLKSLQAPDIKVRPSYGLDYEDRAILESLEGLEDIAYGYELDTRLENDDIIRLHSLSPSMPKYDLITGRLPQAENEIALDSYYAQVQSHQIGDSLRVYPINKDTDIGDQIKEENFEIVGLVESPEYLMEQRKGVSPLGKTSLSAFALIQEDAFLLEDYSSAHLSFEDSQAYHSASEDYEDLLDRKKDEVNQALIARPEARLRAIQDELYKEIDEAELDLEDAKDQLSQAEKDLIKGKEDLEEGFQEYEEGKEAFEEGIAQGQADLDQAQRDLDQARKEIDKGQADYDRGQAELDRQVASGQAKINQGKADLVASRVRLDEGWAKHRAGLDQLDENLAPHYAELEEQKAQLDAAKAQLDEAKANYQKMLDSAKPDPQPEPDTDTETGSKGPDKETSEEEKQPEKDQPDEEKEASPKEEASTEGQASGQASLSGESKASPKLEEIQAQIQAQEEAYLQGLAQYEGAKAQLDNKYKEEKARLDKAQAELEAGEASYQAGQARIREAERQLNQERAAGQSKLDQAQNQLITARAQLQAGLADYEEGLADFERERAQSEKDLEKAYKDLIEAEEELNQGYEDFKEESEEASSEISEGQDKIDQAKESVLSLATPDYTVTTIMDNEGVATYYDNSKRMDALSVVFPLFFYLVAMLVTLTTMTRMVDEERTQIGTLKALGYGNMQIALKYYLYGLIPTLIGAFIGSFVGIGLLSKLIFDAYSSGFIIDDQLVNINWGLILVSLALSAGLILFTVHMTVRKTVDEVPAKLLRPKPPKAGNHIFLERVKPIWSRLSFMHKITARNIFRYKSRMAMTILGVAGCTALIFFGFAMRDSITLFSDIQFDQIMKYDLVSIFDPDADQEDLIHYERLLSDEKTCQALYQTGKVSSRTGDQDVNIVIPEDPAAFEDFVDLSTPSGQDLDLQGQGVILTEKIAKLANIEAGDIIRIIDEDDVERELEVRAISENYFGHYIYMSPSYYEEVFQEEPQSNANYIITDKVDELESDLVDASAVLAIVSIESSRGSTSELLGNLDLVIIIILVISTILAIVVLYNLNNVNISERKQELATIKVLGFYPKEVTAYVYRETLVLTIFGILAGYLLGYLLLRFILAVVVSDLIMMVYKVKARTYVISALITLTISFVVMLIVHQKLKEIDMVEALKGTD